MTNAAKTPARGSGFKFQAPEDEANSEGSEASNVSPLKKKQKPTFEDLKELDQVSEESGFNSRVSTAKAPQKGSNKRTSDTSVQIRCNWELRSRLEAYQERHPDLKKSGILRRALELLEAEEQGSGHL